MIDDHDTRRDIRSVDPGPWTSSATCSHGFPTRPWDVHIWGGLLERIAESPVELRLDGRLQDIDANIFSWKVRWEVWQIHSAFDFLRQKQLVQVCYLGRRVIASVATDRLADRLRHELLLEHENKANHAAYRALSYFRGRRFIARVPWLADVMQAVERSDPESEQSQGGKLASP